MEELLFFKWQLLIIIFLLGIGIIILRKGKRRFDIYRKMKHFATSKVSSMTVGEVEIKGKVVAYDSKIFKTPITQNECVSYDFKLYRWEKSGKENTWVLKYTNVCYENFYVDDGTAKVLINPEGAIIRNDTFYSKQIKSSEIGELLVEVGNLFGQEMKFYDGLYKYEETSIPIGEEVYILGNAVENKNVENDPNIQRLMIQKKDNVDFIITDEKESQVHKVYLYKVVVMYIFAFILIFFCLIQIFNIFDWIDFIGDFKK